MSDNLPPIRLGNREWEFNPDVYGWTIKSTATHNIDVCKLLFHYRIAMTPIEKPFGWDHGWCYSGGRDDLMDAVIAAIAWDPDTEAEPFGWSKRACHVRELT